MEDRKVSPQTVYRWSSVYFLLTIMFQLFVMQFHCRVIDAIIVGIALPALLTLALIQRRQ